MSGLGVETGIYLYPAKHCQFFTLPKTRPRMETKVDMFLVVNLRVGLYLNS